jgi:hypothetical protein
MHPLCLLLNILPLLLVEQRAIPRPSDSPPVIQMAQRLPRRTHRRAKGSPRQQHELVPMPHHLELQQDVSEGIESRESNCGDQEEHGFLIRWMGLVYLEYCDMSTLHVLSSYCGEPRESVTELYIGASAKIISSTTASCHFRTTIPSCRKYIPLPIDRQKSTRQ